MNSVTRPLANIDARENPQALSHRFAGLCEHQRQALLEQFRHADIDLACLPLVPLGEDAITTTVTRPSSVAQQQLWYLWQIDPDTTDYRIPALLAFDGDLEIDALQHALDRIEQRHPALRTCFAEDDGGQLWQQISPARGIMIERHNLDTATPELEQALFEQLCTRPFDLGAGPLWQFHLLEGSENRLLIIAHHSVSDDHSMRILFHELTTVLAGEEMPTPAPLAAADAARWAYYRQLAGQDQRDLAFWQRQFAMPDVGLELPTLNDDSTHRYELTFSAPETRALQQLARDQRVSLHNLCLTALDWVLAPLAKNTSGPASFDIALPVSTRQRAELDDSIGFFVNTLPHRARVAAQQSFADALEAVASEQQAALEHSGIAFNRLNRLRREQQPEVNPIRIKMTEHLPLPAPVRINDRLSLRVLELDRLPVHYPLNLDFRVQDNRLICRFASHASTTDSRGFNTAELETISNRFHALLTRVSQNPQLTPATLEEAPTAPLPLLQHWQHVVKTTPEKVLLQDTSGTLNAAQLETGANALAARIRTQLPDPLQQPVGVVMGRTNALPMTILALFKLGAIYTPLERDQPSSRLQSMVTRAGISLVLTDADTDITDLKSPTLKVEPEILAATDSAPMTTVMPEKALAYLIHTSGSTGEPKAVMISHAALRHYLDAVSNRLALEANEQLALASTPAADLGHTLLFLTLYQGQPLAMLPQSSLLDPEQFRSRMQQHKVDVIKLVPTHLAALLEADNAGELLPRKRLILGGEALTPALFERIRSLRPDLKIYNHYGPSETTVGVAMHCLSDSAPMVDGRLPMGSALDSARLQVLDEQRNAVADGVCGELYIGGKTLADGYLNHPLETASAFVPDPVHPGLRLYRSGDRVIRHGELFYFVGRGDHQVKINGYRIDPAETAAVTRATAGVRQVHVAVIDDPHSHRPTLCAYIVADDSFSPEQLAQRYRAQLPAPAQAHWCVTLDRLPVTPNGKLDTHALPTPGDNQRLPTSAGTAHTRHAETAASSSALPVLQAICSQLLKNPNVSATDNFFALGGDSILGLQLVARLRKKGWRISVQDLQQADTLQALALRAQPLQQPSSATTNVTLTLLCDLCAEVLKVDRVDPARSFADLGGDSILALTLIARLRKRGYRLRPDILFACASLKACAQELTAIAPAKADKDIKLSADSLPLSPQQQAFLAAPPPNPAHWNQSLRLELHQRPMPAQLQKALNTVAYNHPLLRAKLADDGHSLRYDATVCWALEHRLVDSETLRQQAIDEAQQSLNLTQGPLLRALWLETNSGDNELILIAHHLLVDGISWRALLTDLDAVLRGQEPQPSSAQPAAYARLWQHLKAISQQPDTARILSQWQHQLDRAVSLPSVGSACLGDRHHHTQTLAISEHHDLGERLHAAFACALADWLTADVVGIDMESHGRSAAEAAGLDLSHAVGWFSSVYTLPLPLIDDPTTALQNLTALLAKARQHGDCLALTQPASGKIRCNFLGRIDSQDSGLFIVDPTPQGMERDPKAPARYGLDVDMRVVGNHLLLNWHTLPEFIDDATTARLQQRFAAALGALDQPAYTPLSPLQEGMLLHALNATQYSDNTQAYLGQLRLTFELEDAARLQRAWQRAVNRHPVLRTRFVWQGVESPQQIVESDVTLPIECFDASDLTGAELEAFLASRAEEAIDNGFNPSQAPLMNLQLIRLPTTATPRWHLIWTRHHLLLDGHSSAALLAEILADLTAPVEAEQPPLADPAPGFIAWLAEQDHNTARNYWQARLESLDTPTRILDLLPPAEEGQSARETLNLSAPEAIINALRAARITPHTLIAGLWGLILQRLGGQRSVALGTPVSLRQDQLRPGNSPLGLFLNTIPVVINAGTDDQPLRSWLAELQRQQLSDLEQAFLPLTEIQQQSPAQESLFDLLLVSNPGLGAEQIQGLKVESSEEFDSNHYPLTLMLTAHNHGLEIRLGFDTARVNHKAAKALMDACERLLQQFIDHGDRPLQQLQLWPTETAKPPVFTHPATLPQRLVQMAQYQPSQPALADADRQLNYAQLEQRSRELAHYLRSHSTNPLIAVQSEPTLDAVILITAILRAGLVYLPLDPALPKVRLQEIMDRLQPGMLMDVREGLPEVTDCPPDLLAQVAPSQTAYLILTSGSTGLPKPVSISHQALAHYCTSLGIRIGLEANWRCGLTSTLAADLGHSILFGALYHGASLQIAPTDARIDGAAFARWLEQTPVDLLKFVPGHLQALQQAAHALAPDSPCPLPRRALLLGGEALPADYARTLQQQAQHLAIYNHYGPSETTVGVLMHRLDARLPDPDVPLGTPLEHVQPRICDSTGAALPAGLCGELWLSGPMLAEGYLNMPKTTARSFVETEEQRWYRTGDRLWRDTLGRYRFSGRLDEQIKIRGYRIEPGEIEAALKQHPVVGQARVILRENCLVAYITARAPLSPDALKPWLKERLPSAAIPAHIVLLERLPLTANGKLDRRALPPLEQAEDTTCEPLVSDTEKTLAELWQRYLGDVPLHRHSHFFNCGGQSLLTIRLNAAIQQTFKVMLPVRQLFETPVLMDLAGAIDAARGDNSTLDLLDNWLNKLEVDQ